MRAAITTAVLQRMSDNQREGRSPHSPDPTDSISPPDYSEAVPPPSYSEVVAETIPSHPDPTTIPAHNVTVVPRARDEDIDMVDGVGPDTGRDDDRLVV